jgi:two-component system, sensor histidine kinase PdtaS
MIDEDSSGGSDPPPGVIFQNPDQCLPAAELTDYRLIAVRLRKALAKSEALLLQKSELIHRLELLTAESDHRLLNNLQMTISLLFAAEP